MAVIMGLVLAAIPIVVMIIQYFEKKRLVKIDYENIVFAQYKSGYGEISENAFLVLYGLSIVNRSRKNTTIKSVKLSYRINHKKFTTGPRKIQTGKLQNGIEAVIIYLALIKSNLVLMNWKNVSTVVDNQKLLSSGEVLKASAVFSLVCSIYEVRNITDVKLEIEDYYGKKTHHKIKMQEKWLNTSDKQGLIIDNKFIISEKDEVIWN